MTIAQDDIPRGLALCALGYLCFSMQDATVKWLVATYSVPEILLFRSFVVVAIACLIGRRQGLTLFRPRNPSAILTRASLMLMAWFSYYSAARSLGLAELTTIYFAAPVITVALSVFVLGERVNAGRWAAVLVGFAGVMTAAAPHGDISGLTPALAAFFAAICWGMSSILIRVISRSDSTASQIVLTNSFFAAACAIALPWMWQTPDLAALAMMLGLGVASGFGQFLLYEGFRYAPASVAAPMEYTGLIWAFVYEYLIWNDVPHANVFGGALLIVGASLTLVWSERQRRRGFRGATVSSPDTAPP